MDNFSASKRHNYTLYYFVVIKSGPYNTVLQYDADYRLDTSSSSDDRSRVSLNDSTENELLDTK